METFGESPEVFQKKGALSPLGLLTGEKHGLLTRAELESTKQAEDGLSERSNLSMLLKVLLVARDLSLC